MTALLLSTLHKRLFLRMRNFIPIFQRVTMYLRYLRQNYLILLFCPLCCLLIVLAIDGDRYKMPVPLVGLISCLALWEFFNFCSNRWGLAGYPMTRQCLIRLVQCGE